MERVLNLVKKCTRCLCWDRIFLVLIHMYRFKFTKCNCLVKIVLDRFWHLCWLRKYIACPSAWTIRVSFFYVPENYPNTIREKKQSPWTIQILSQKFWQNVVKKTNTWNYPRKKTNTLNYPNTIRYFGDLAKFSRILHENKKIYHLCFFL